MEKLEKLLMDYNLQHIDDLIVSPWSKQYCRTPFPLYWQKVYDIMEKIDRKLKVFEIGCGQGDVTTIFCYLGFHSVCSFEKVPQLAENAKRRIENLFDRKDIIIQP